MSQAEDQHRLVLLLSGCSERRGTLWMSMACLLLSELPDNGLPLSCCPLQAIPRAEEHMFRVMWVFTVLFHQGRFWMSRSRLFPTASPKDGQHHCSAALLY